MTFEWPKGCESWSRHDVKSFFDAHPEFQLVEFDGCAVGVRSTKGRPIKKTWRLMTTSQRIVDAFSQHKCTHSPHEHDHAVGSQTAKTAAPAPAMPCVVPAAASQAREEEHRVKEQSLKHISALAGADAFALAVETDEVADQMAECLMDLETLVRTAFDIPEGPKHNGRVHAMVTKLLSRAEMLANPKAVEKVKEEATSLTDIGTWDLDSVREYDAVKEEAKASKVSVHFGRLMTIASIKFWELAEHLHKMKGRL